MKDFLWLVVVHYWPWILVGGMVVFFFVSIFLTACWEKHPIRQYEPGAPEDAAPPSGYFLAMNAAARRFNLLHGGNYLQTRDSSLYQCCVSLWLTADQYTLILVGGGRMAKMDYKRTLFISVTTDGRELVTMDEFGTCDLSGMREIDVVYRACFEELVARHGKRLKESTKSLRSFSLTGAMSQYEDLGKVRAEKMVARGLAKFLDLQESAWRYIVKGAFLAAYEGYLRGTQKAKQQSDRAHLKRPGS